MISTDNITPNDAPPVAGTTEGAKGTSTSGNDTALAHDHSLLKIAYVAHRKAPVSKVASVTWAALASRLTKHDDEIIAGAKDEMPKHDPRAKDGPAWMPAEIDPGPRTGERVRSVTALVLDVEAETDDEADANRVKTGNKIVTGVEPPDVDAMLEKLKDSGWSCILHTSHSHHGPHLLPNDQLHHRYRLIFQISRPLSHDEIKPLGLLVARKLGLDITSLDTGCLEAARLYYLPRCPAERKNEARGTAIEGTPLPIDALLLEAKHQPAPAPRMKAGTLQLNDDANLFAGVPLTLQYRRDLQSALDALPCDDYSEWMAGSLGLKSEGDQCRSMWLDWSQTSTKWKPTDALRWDDFEPRPGTTSRIIFTMAERHGWLNPASNAAKYSVPAELELGELVTGNGGDVANGRMYSNMHRNKLMHVHETGDWLAFDDVAGWIAAPPGEEDRAAKKVLTRMREIAAERYRAAPDDTSTKRLFNEVTRTSKAGALRAMIDMARSEPGMTCRATDFDNNDMLLGVLNGVLDLRTMQLLPVSPDVLVSKRAGVSYDPAATCPLFHRFLKDVQPEPSMRSFLQRFAGYCLTGKVDEQKLLFLFGSGANGKSVFIELLAFMLGDYSKKIATEMLMQHQRSPQGPSPDIVALKGARLIYANETEEGRRLAESRVKEMTGGDTLSGRVPFSKSDITFRPSHKLVIVGNHRPEITDNSHGMWRRVALTPFDVTIPENKRDPDLLEHLCAEGAGVLNWMLGGLREWVISGLGVPTVIEAATAAYRDEQDIVGEWIAERCQQGEAFQVKKEEAYSCYQSWAKTNGHHPMAQKRLTRRLGDRGFPLSSDKRKVNGLELAHEQSAGW
jgi:putative DNA primase/helicase